MAGWGAAWLGGDAEAGQEVAHPDVALDVAALTEVPRKYGFHGTIKAPFRLADGVTRGGLEAALAGFCQQTCPVVLDGINVSKIGSFLALTPEGDPFLMRELARAVVCDLDRFRAPLSDAEIGKRRKNGLSKTQDEHLLAWGYPYVMDEFRFHMTLSGPLDVADQAAALAVLKPLFSPYLTEPFTIDSLCLAGEDAEGRFHLLRRYVLTGE